MTKLRKFGVEQSCPLCRAPLPAGPEKLFEESTRRFIVFERKGSPAHAATDGGCKSAAARSAALGGAPAGGAPTAQAALSS